MINPNGNHHFPHRYNILPKPLYTPLQSIRFRQPNPFFFNINTSLTTIHSAHIINAHNIYKTEQDRLFLAKYVKITNTKTHNLSTTILTTTQQLVLGLGPKFVIKDHINKNEIKININNDLQKLKRRIQLNMFFNNDNNEKQLIPTNETKDKWQTPPRPYDY